MNGLGFWFHSATQVHVEIVGDQAGRPVTQVVVGALLGHPGHHQKTPAGSAPAATSVFDKPAAHLKTI